MVRVAVVGKGGSGKSLLAGTLARILARRGERVLAIDSDTMPGLAFSLGCRPPAVPALIEATEKGPDGRWRFRRGIGPVRAVQRFAYEAPDGVRLLEFGKLGPEGRGELLPAIQALYQAARGIGDARSFRDWCIVGDLPAGPRQVAYDWAPYARTYLVVAEPTMQSLLTARRLRRIAASRPGTNVTVVASKVSGPDDLRRIEGFLGVRAAAVLPREAAVAQAERAGTALIDHAPRSATAMALEELAERLAVSATSGPSRPRPAAGRRTPRSG